jgi:hypothetical protein
MGRLLGSSPNISTWAKFRCTWGIDDDGLIHFIDYNHNITFYKGFKSAASGSGLIRYAPPDYGGVYWRQPYIFNVTYLVSFNPTVAGFRIGTVPAQAVGSNYESAAATIELQTLLTGQSIQFSSGQSTTMTSGLWTTNRKNWFQFTTSRPTPWVSGITYMEFFDSPMPPP